MSLEGKEPRPTDPLYAAPDMSLAAMRQRGLRRKSGWNLVLPVGWVLGGAGTFAVVCLGMLRLQDLLMPAGVYYRAETLGVLLMLLPAVLFAIIAGLPLANLLAWCMPPARRAMTGEARQADQRFGAATLSVARFAGYVGAIALPLSLLGTRDYVAISDAGLTHQAFYDWQPTTYTWDTLGRVRLVCRRGHKGGIRSSFVVETHDGQEFDLMRAAIGYDFGVAYGPICEQLRAHHVPADRSGIDRAFLGEVSPKVAAALAYH